MSFGIQAKEGGCDFIGADCGVVAVPWHLSFARTGQAVRVDGKKAASEVTTGTAETPQGALKFFTVLNGMSHKQIVNALIGNNKGKTVEEFETLLAESSGSTNVHNTQSSLVNELHGHSG